MSALALTVVKDRVQVVVREPEADAAPDKLALVRDDLREVRADLDSITKTLGANLAEVARAIERLADEQARLHQGIVAVRDRLPGLDPAPTRRALADLARELDRLQKRLEAVAVAAPAGRGPEPDRAAEPDPVAKPDPVAEAGKPGEQTTAPATPATPPGSAKAEEPDRSAEAPAAAPPRKTGFLSFALPSRSFAFDRWQTFRILPSLSRVGFDAKSTLHDFSGVTSKVQGDFSANLADAKRPWSGAISCEAASLRTGVDGRDEGLREHLETGKHPDIRFELLGFEPADKGVDAGKMQTKGTVKGRMTIRGKSRELSMPVTVHVDESRRVVIEGQAPLKLTDYGVPVPSQLGLISMQDEVKVWIALRARSVGGEK